MLSSLALAVMAGEFVALIGTIFERNFATLCSIIPIIAIAAISFHYLPDTPLYFIKRNDEKVRKLNAWIKLNDTKSMLICRC